MPKLTVRFGCGIIRMSKGLFFNMLLKQSKIEDHVITEERVSILIFLRDLFKFFSKGFDLSSNMTKDDDTKAILVGISAILALVVGAIKIYENYLSIKRLLRVRKK